MWWEGFNSVAMWSWLPGDGGPMASVGIMVDPLSRTMLVLVALVSLLVQIYSLGYLADEPAPSLGRYYAYQSLFAFSMLGLVLSPTFLQMFVFWELVGLCSYLLIGFWYDRPAAARAALKAFWITKLGDLGFIAGIVMLWAATGTFELPALLRMAQEGTIPLDGLGVIMFLIYLGAVGKSAQFPLHVWLPDAMEGPTPVSALIHAATMVTAGVFMVTRAHALFALVPEMLSPHRMGGGVHRVAGGDHGLRGRRYQAGACVLDGLAARLHDGGRGSRSASGRLSPSAHPRHLQGLALPGGGRRHSCRGHQRHLPDGRVAAGHAADRDRLHRGHVGPGWGSSVVGLLLEGSRPGGGVGKASWVCPSPCWA